MINRLPLKECVQGGSRDASKCWEINDNLLETVQDRDSYSRTLLGNCMWSIE